LLSEWETEIADTCSALAVMQARPVDVIIVGQLVVREKAQMLITVAKELKPPPEVMVIRYSGELVDFDAETHLNDLLESPGWLPEWVKQAVARRSRID
jgi:hypothetical protein